MMKSQEPPCARRPWPLAGPLPLLAALALLGPAGCRSVPPDPFEAFQTTLVELQEATDQVWEASVQLAQDRALGRVETSTALRRSNVIMRPAAEDSFGWEMEEPPLYFRLRESQRAFRELGGSFADYAALLVALSGGEISSAEEFEERAASLNANLRSAASAMGLEGDPEGTALISTAAAEALRSYLASQQRSALLKAVEAAQPAIERFARLGGDTIELLTLDLWEEYERFVREMPPPDAEGDEGDRIARLILRDEEHIDGLSALRALQRSYLLLPKAHADLKRALTDEDDPLTWIWHVYGEARRLREQAAALAGATGEEGEGEE